MKVGEAVAEIMKREGIEILCGYPVNHLLEYAAAADIRPIIVRQERIGRTTGWGMTDLGHQNPRVVPAEVERQHAPAELAKGGLKVPAGIAFQHCAKLTGCAAMAH